MSVMEKRYSTGGSLRHQLCQSLQDPPPGVLRCVTLALRGGARVERLHREQLLDQSGFIQGISNPFSPRTSLDSGHRMLEERSGLAIVSALVSKRKNPKEEERLDIEGYDEVFAELTGLVEDARRSAARSVNALMTAIYWAIGRRIVQHEQHGEEKAGYGDELIRRLSRNLTARFGRGFGRSNLFQMRSFFLAYRDPNPLAAAGPRSESSHSTGETVQTASGLLDPTADTEKVQTVSGLFNSALLEIAAYFPLSWSHYTRLLSVQNPTARAFYEAEALRGGWTVRQLRRQIETQFFERTALSRDKASMLRSGSEAQEADGVTPEEAIKDPYLLEFLDLKDEYSETELEEALIRRLETFLLELGPEFTFVGRQRRLRVGNAWYRVDLVFFHRGLRCIVIIDLKLGELTHADAGQMHLYCNYAREHWTLEGENPPVGLILCAQKDTAGALRPGWASQQGLGRGIPDRPTERASTGRGDRADTTDPREPAPAAFHGRQPFCQRGR